MGFKFDTTYKLSTTALYLNLGHPSLPLTLKWMANMFIYYVAYTLIFYTVIYSSIFHDDFTKICTNLGMGILFCVITFSYAILIIYKENFKKMISTTEDILEKSKELSFEEQTVVKNYAENGRWVSKLWLITSGGTASLFFLKSIFGTLYSVVSGSFLPVPIYELTYSAYIENVKNDIFVFPILFVFQSFYVVLAVLMYVGFNPLGPIFILHACGQIELIIRKVKTLFLEETDREDSERKLKEIVIDLQYVYSFVNVIQQAHKAYYEMSIKATAVAVPISCFGIIESYRQGSINIELLSYVMACAMQCYVPCYYCEKLRTKGEDLQNAIYGCGWESFWVPKSRSSILIMLTRTAKPLGMRSVFADVCLEAFSDCCNQAYTIFNVVNAAWN